MAKKSYPPFPEHLAKAWRFMELMLRGAQKPEFTVEYFDQLNKQVLYISKASKKDPVIEAMLIAAIDAIEEKARKNQRGRCSA